VDALECVAKTDADGDVGEEVADRLDNFLSVGDVDRLTVFAAIALVVEDAIPDAGGIADGALCVFRMGVREGDEVVENDLFVFGLG